MAPRNKSKIINKAISNLEKLNYLYYMLEGRIESLRDPTLNKTKKEIKKEYLYLKRTQKEIEDLVIENQEA